MKRILIDGAFFCLDLTGIERYSFEITRRLDALCGKDEIAIIIPANANYVPDYKNIAVIYHKKKMKSHLYWQMVTLQRFLFFHREFTVLEYGNTCLPFFPGIVFLHDIYCELFPGDFRTPRDRVIRLYNRWQYRLIAKRALKIVTVSRFIRGQIAGYFRVKPEDIPVIPNGWEHFGELRPDYSIFDRMPELKDGGFYFLLGSLSRRKNLGWMLEYAERHPRSLFVVSGKALPSVRADEIDRGAGMKNIVFSGYLGDREVKALMERCRAFVFPSYYEGFGIPPLEALSCGTPVVVSNAASLPEIFGNAAHYIDPFDAGVDLEDFLKQPVEPPGAVLAKYSWDTSAHQVYELVKDFLRR
jgi:glycosyltransferase involved in cell wall biosynthesis